MEARWEPASIARTEFLDHFVAQERTKKPVTLSSLGPPPDACHGEELLAELAKLVELRRGAGCITRQINCNAASESRFGRGCLISSCELFIRSVSQNPRQGK